jgi:hypothetical protein
VQLRQHEEMVRDVVHEGPQEGGVDCLVTLAATGSLNSPAFASGGQGCVRLWTCPTGREKGVGVRTPPGSATHVPLTSRLKEIVLSVECTMSVRLHVQRSVLCVWLLVVMVDNVLCSSCVGKREPHKTSSHRRTQEPYIPLSTMTTDVVF